MQLLAALILAVPLQQGAPAAKPERAPQISVAAVDGAIERAAVWLRAQQRDDGAFAPKSVAGACTVAMTAMATWSLNDFEPRLLDPAAAERAARYLLSQAREDGGVYDPSRGLAVYTSGVATRALKTVPPREDWTELGAAIAAVELFVYQRRSPESVIDATPLDEVAIGRSSEVARELLASSKDRDAAQRKALEFLARSKRDAVKLPSRVHHATDERHPSEIGPFTYDDLLPLVYLDISPEQQLAMRVRAALGAYYTPDRNPDLTKRYGAAGFEPGSQGLFYYYFVAAKVLSVFGENELVTADGKRHAWPGQLAMRLVRMQRDDGAWANSDPAWWEAEPLLATSYALLTLKLCRAKLAGD